MKQNSRRIRYLAIVVLALAVSLTACGPKMHDNQITGLVVSPSEVALKVGSDGNGTAQLAAKFQYVSGETTDADVNWKSDKPEIATVSADGLVTAVGEGEASVTATAKTNSELSGTASITVSPAGAEDPGNGEPITVALGASSLGLVRTQTFVLNAEVTGADEGEDGVTWNTSNAGAVSITYNGNEATLTATGTGEAKITATSVADADASASVTVNVTALEIAISFEFDPLVVGQGEDGELTATISNTFPDVDLGVTWSASPSALIQFDETTSISGSAITLTAGAVGTVTVTATSAQDSQVKTAMNIEIESTVLDPMNVYVGGPVRIPGADAGTRFNPFEAIQQGVDAVAVGGTVYLTGNFELAATLTINKNDITLLGTAGNKISPVMASGPIDGAHLIVIPSGVRGVTLDSLNLEVLTGSAFGQAVIGLNGSKDITVKNSTFTGDWDAGAGLGTSGLRVVLGSTPWGLVLSGNTFDNMAYPATFYGSVAHRGDAHTSITNNHAIGTKSWLFTGAPEGITLNGNTFENSVCASATAVQITFSVDGPASDPSYLTHIEAISIANDNARVRFIPMVGATTYAGTPCYTGD